MGNEKKSYKCMVCIGDSITSGRKATQERKCWVNRLGALISEFQDEPIKIINKGIGSNVLVDHGEAYQNSRKPSGKQRLWRDVIAYSPDLIVIAFGTNDLRGGASVACFIAELKDYISFIKARTKATIVVLSTYFIQDYKSAAHWNKASAEIFKASNEKVKMCCDHFDVVYADVYLIMAEISWAVDKDMVHPNDLGHMLIASCVFESLCRYDDTLSHKAYTDAVEISLWQDEKDLYRTDDLLERV